MLDQLATAPRGSKPELEEREHALRKRIDERTTRSTRRAFVRAETSATGYCTVRVLVTTDIEDGAINRPLNRGSSMDMSDRAPPTIARHDRLHRSAPSADAHPSRIRSSRATFFRCGVVAVLSAVTPDFAEAGRGRASAGGSGNSPRTRPARATSD
jgi:hypothetical protein